MTGRQFLLAVLLTAAGVIKGKRLLWDAIDDMTSWLVEKTDGLDMGWDAIDDMTSWLVEKTDSLDLGWDVPDVVPAEWVSEQ